MTFKTEILKWMREKFADAFWPKKINGIYNYSNHLNHVNGVYLDLLGVINGLRTEPCEGFYMKVYDEIIVALFSQITEYLSNPSVMEVTIAIDEPGEAPAAKFSQKNYEKNEEKEVRKQLKKEWEEFEKSGRLLSIHDTIGVAMHELISIPIARNHILGLILKSFCYKFKEIPAGKRVMIDGGKRFQYDVKGFALLEMTSPPDDCNSFHLKRYWIAKGMDTRDRSDVDTQDEDDATEQKKSLIKYPFSGEMDSKRIENILEIGDGLFEMEDEDSAVLDKLNEWYNQKLKIYPPAEGDNKVFCFGLRYDTQVIGSEDGDVIVIALLNAFRWLSCYMGPKLFGMYNPGFWRQRIFIRKRQFIDVEPEEGNVMDASTTTTTTTVHTHPDERLQPLSRSISFHNEFDDILMDVDRDNITNEDYHTGVINPEHKTDENAMKMNFTSMEGNNNTFRWNKPKKRVIGSYVDINDLYERIIQHTDRKISENPMKYMRRDENGIRRETTVNLETNPIAFEFPVELYCFLIALKGNDFVEGLNGLGFEYLEAKVYERLDLTLKMISVNGQTKAFYDVTHPVTYSLVMPRFILWVAHCYLGKFSFMTKSKPVNKRKSKKPLDLNDPKHDPDLPIFIPRWEMDEILHLALPKNKLALAINKYEQIREKIIKYKPNSRTIPPDVRKLFGMAHNLVYYLSYFGNGINPIYTFPQGLEIDQESGFSLYGYSKRDPDGDDSRYNVKSSSENVALDSYIIRGKPILRGKEFWQNSEIKKNVLYSEEDYIVE